MMNEIFIIAVSLAFGSFGNNIISRYTNNSKFDFLRSHCMCGKNILTLRELIPVANYIYLKGKCSVCKTTLPLRYFIIEISTAAIGLTCFYVYDSLTLAALNFLIFYCLLLIGTIDLLIFIIPNALVTALLFISIIRNFNIRDDFFTDYTFLLGLLIPFLFILLNILSEMLFQKTAIGYGDIKLLFVFTLTYRVISLLIGIWVFSIAAIFGFYLLKMYSPGFRNENRVPFGFFLSIGFILLGLSEESIINLFYYLIES